MFTFEFDHLDWLSQFYSEWRQTSKLVNFEDFCLGSDLCIITMYPIHVKIWKWLRLLNSVLFITKTLVNQVYIRIWSSWLTFTVSQWMRTNFKISQFEDYC